MSQIPTNISLNDEEMKRVHQKTLIDVRFLLDIQVFCHENL